MNNSDYVVNSQVHPTTPVNSTIVPNSVNVKQTLGIPAVSGFKIASLNLVSLCKHVDQLRIYMLSKVVDILAINETRLDSTVQNGEINILGYTIQRKDRNRFGGGVALLCQGLDSI